MSEEKTILYRVGNSSNLVSLLDKWNSPALYWLEPQPGMKDLNKPGPVCESVCTKLPDSLPNLAELRLFWADRSVHIVANGENGYRWFEFGQKLPDMNGCETKSMNVLVRDLKLQSRKNWANIIAKQPAALSETLRAITYLHPDTGQVFAWRLEV